ncbi:hypothetical protein HMPREF9241_01217 [Schaalia turicensis ACS-279-V-Col4]|uniref:DUF7973 domain-containing protein n=1 Tax=Schaalia turicensis ACS-279-V-Col4 TaxID=883077 RepID=K0YQF2_9ACTO|nr:MULTISPECIES: hypothetical protein [Actinomycetaceae]MDK7781407.1 hypothetical protein [Actinomycetaceae bacterium UMB8041B]MDK8294235.1 hypothetical protein [Actinomycetaceae bacterium UMB8039B]MDK8608369.1 hypothetical protein [Actinomycetaceae bacterium UMB8041A]MDK8753587.1 hypothetical protein [Actinomycetaceae bacterium UMB8039A]EJZ85673.1 hypothetical protein HMPREF9241_01217 [Schaalia turicensis ACS-279-V-Col4]
MTPDAALAIGSNMNLFWLLMAAAGGVFGTMIGANYAFSFTGVTILLGFGVAAATGSTTVLDYVSFGPAFGPHIAFAGGVAAAAYAAKKGYLKSGGKDINSPLAGLGKPDVLLIGALFGVGGYLFQKLVALVPWFGTHTDSVAFTVVCSGILVRVVFGKTGVFHSITKPEGTTRWLDWQETPGQLLTVSAFAGLFASGIATMLVGYIAPNSANGGVIIANAQAIPFGISALCIFFVAGGLKFPVTHHMTISAGLAAVLFFNATGSGMLAVLVGTCFGVLAGFAGEYFARWTYAHGDTHIDPPAGVIWLMNTLAVSAAALVA